MEDLSGKLFGTVISWTLKFILYLAVAFVIYEGVSISYSFGHDIFYATTVSPPPGRDVKVVIEDGMTVSQTGELLYNYGLITNKYSFIVQAYFFDLKINPGTYTFNTSNTSREILENLDTGVLEETDDNES